MDRFAPARARVRGKPPAEEGVVHDDEQVTLGRFDDAVEHEDAAAGVDEVRRERIALGEVGRLPAQLAAQLEHLVEVQELVAELVGDGVDVRPGRNLARPSGELRAHAEIP